MKNNNFLTFKLILKNKYAQHAILSFYGWKHNKAITTNIYHCSSFDYYSPTTYT